jgi:hypothetical protein
MPLIVLSTEFVTTGGFVGDAVGTGSSGISFGDIVGLADGNAVGVEEVASTGCKVGGGMGAMDGTIEMDGAVVFITGDILVGGKVGSAGKILVGGKVGSAGKIIVGGTVGSAGKILVGGKVGGARETSRVGIELRAVDLVGGGV